MGLGSAAQTETGEIVAETVEETGGSAGGIGDSAVALGAPVDSAVETGEAGVEEEVPAAEMDSAWADCWFLGNRRTQAGIARPSLRCMLRRLRSFLYRHCQRLNSD